MRAQPVARTPAAGIAGIVLSRREVPPWSARWFALGVGVTVHLGVGLASAMIPPPAPAVVMARPPVRISVVREVALPPPPEPAETPPAHAPAEQARARPSHEAPPPTEPTPAEEAPAAPAVAADVVQAAAPAPDPAEPLDFSVVTGEGQVYAGGVTASTGTSTHAVHTDNVDARHGVTSSTGEGAPASSRARPVGQPTRAWSCDWPRAASGLDVDVEFVNMRVAVEADGEITDVRIIRHAGYGFDEEARRCALRHRLPPARDHGGVAIRTASHAIRLRFER